MIIKSGIFLSVIVSLLNKEPICEAYGTFKQFRTYLKSLDTIVVFTGAGISVDSGIPTNRGTWGYWRGHSPRDLDTLKSFHRKNTTPLVWEFMNYKRYLVSKAKPNKAHYAIVDLQNYFIEEGKGRTLTIITMTVDGLHTVAGSYNVCEVLGNVWKTMCTKCDNVETNTDIPVAPAFKNSWHSETCNIKYEDLPRCKKCNGLLKPHVIFPDEFVNITISRWMTMLLTFRAEMILFVGVNLSNYFTGQYARVLRARAAIVAEFNTYESYYSKLFRFHFHGRCVDTLPTAIDLRNLTY